MTDRNALLDRLTGQIYEGVLTEEGWGEALRTISLVTSSPQASLVVFNKQTQALAVGKTFGIPDEAVSAFNSYYHQLDEGRAHATTMPFGNWYLDRRDLGENIMRRSEYYQDFLLRYGAVTTLCNRLVGDTSAEAFLSLQRRSGQPHYTDADLTAFGQFLPHVQRAVRLRMHMQRLAERAGLASVVLDQLHMALLVLDEHGGILLANAEADALMRRRPQQLTARHGCLHPKGLRPGQFAHMVQSACGCQSPATAGGALLQGAQGQPALQLLVLPLPAPLQAFNHWGRPLALVMLNEPDQQRSVRPRLLQQLYGLTPAETRLALVLCQGDTLTEAARRLGVSVGTVRVQLRSIFAKTGTNRQANLIRTLAALCIAG